MADRLELEARFKDLASGGVKKLGKTLESVRPSNGMQAAQKWMSDFRKESDAAFKTVRPLQSGLSALGVGGLAASFSLGEIVKQMRELGDSTLTMRELGRQSGMTMDQIRRLNYVAGRLHVDPSAVTNALKSWSNQMLDFRTTRSDFYRYLNSNNNADVAKRIAADSPEQGFKDTLDYLSRIPAAAMKAGRSQADAMQIQRRVAEMAGVGDMVPALANGPEGLRQVFADAAREVKPMSAELVAAAEKLNASTVRMNQSWDNLKNDVGPYVIDPMSKMIDKLDSVLKGVAADPGSAAAEAGVGALTAGALYARRRIMAGSKLAGGSGLDRAAGELTGAAGALKQAAAALEGAKASPGGGGAPSEGGKPGGGSFDKGRALMAGLGLVGVVANAPGMDAAGDHERDANASALESFGDAARRVLGVDWLTRKVDEWRGGGPSDKGAHPDDDRLSRARPDDLKRDVQEGSKAGIIAGLRELAQQQELDGGGAGGLGAGDPIKGWAGGRGGGQMHSAAASIRYNRQHARGGGSGPVAPFHLDGNQSKQLGDGIRLASQHLGIDPKDLATAISYETGGTMDPWKAGPHTKWGWHHGLIQWGEPQARQYGVNARSTIGEQMAAVERYLRDAGVKPGMGMRDVYSAINAGHVGKYGASDRPGMTVASHVEGMTHSAHRTALDRLDRQAGGAGAGLPAPSSAAVSDAEAFKARAKALNGTPPGHRAGGWISGPGTGTSDSIPAMLSNGEYVVQAKAAGAFLPLLHAINSGTLARFAGGGPVGFGVARQFYPTSSPGISDAEGAGNRRFWRDFMRRPRGAGGMGASWRTTLATLAMMQGESGRGLNGKLFNWDVNGPSGGVDQLHDVTTGRGAGKLRRLSDLMTLGMQQHADWRDPWIQAANFKREALGSMNFAWRKMVAARSAGAALKEGIDKFENPADHARELLRRMPNLVRLQREALADGAATRQELGPLDVTIRHHHDGRTSVQAKAGKGVRLGIKTGPTMRPT